MEDKKLLILDGLNGFFRAFIVNSALTSGGKPCGGICGFLKIIQKYIKELNPDLIVVCWDGVGGSKKRKELLPEYKHDRKPPRLNRFVQVLTESEDNQNKIWQLQRLIQYINHTPIIQFLFDHVEADDLVAYICRLVEFEDFHKYIVSNDKDFIQLVNDKTTLIRPTQDEVLTPQKVVDIYGIHPNNHCLAKAVCGDKSDNIQGLPGWGFKTLIKIFPAFRDDITMTLTDLLKCATLMADDPKNKYRQKSSEVVNSSVQLARNQQLVCLGDLPLSYNNKEKILWTFDNHLPQFSKISFIHQLREDNLVGINLDPMFDYFHRIQNQSKL